MEKRCVPLENLFSARHCIGRNKAKNGTMSNDKRSTLEANCTVARSGLSNQLNRDNSCELVPFSWDLCFSENCAGQMTQIRASSRAGLSQCRSSVAAFGRLRGVIINSFSKRLE